LEVARVETGEQQPNPASFRHALKEVIKNCIYGVDKNPLAVELCKVALWLESHNPGEPLSFLDHRIKCGDAIVGLAHREELQKGIPDEAYQMLPGDDKEISSTFLKKNKQERGVREKSGQVVQLTTEADHKLMEQVKELNRLIENFSNLPENTPEEIEKKAKAYRILINSHSLKRLKILADLRIMPFFLPKSEINKDLLLTDAVFHRYLRGETKVPTAVEGKAIELAVLNRFFHWFLEFPEILQNGGFDCILGNPPFLGDRRLKEAFGENYLEWIRYNFSEGATIDLVVYFFLRVNSLVKKSGFQSLISTNTVAQGKAREYGLEKIIANGSTINHAVKGMKWPGLAAVEVSLVSIYKGDWKKALTLNGKKVKEISAFLDDSANTGTPYPLKANEGKSYQGSIVLGTGYILDKANVSYLLNINDSYKEVIKPYLNGDDLNSNPDQMPSRYVIDFRDLDEIQAKKYIDIFNILEEYVRPERWKKQSDKSYPFWWHWRPRKELYKKIEGKEKVLVSSRVSKYVNQSFIEVGPVFDVATTVVVRSEFWEYTLLQNSMHNIWAWKYGSTMKFDIRYTNGDCIDTFPFPEQRTPTIIQGLDLIGREYHELRIQLMLLMKLGLTKTYNAFHAKDISERIISIAISSPDKKTIEKQFGKESWNLINHLQKTEGSCSIEEAVIGIVKLRELHVEMDNTVLEAYGWKDIDLKHDFYEMENLPENDRVRFTIHPDARKEVLKRLLDLNHKIHEEEVKAGLWDKKTGTKKAGKEKSTGDQVSEPEKGYGGLFG